MSAAGAAIGAEPVLPKFGAGVCVGALGTSAPAASFADLSGFGGGRLGDSNPAQDFGDFLAAGEASATGGPLCGNCLACWSSETQLPSFIGVANPG